MRKILTIFIIALMGIVLTACDRTSNDKVHSVVFYTSGAELIDTIYNIKPGSKIEKPEDPQDLRDGVEVRTFVAWYKDPGLTEEWDFETDTVDRSLTLYADWDYVVYTITYHLDGGVFPEDYMDYYPMSYTVTSQRLFVWQGMSARNPVHPERGRFLGFWQEPNLTAEERRDSAKYPRFDVIETGSYGNLDLYAYYRD